LSQLLKKLKKCVPEAAKGFMLKMNFENSGGNEKDTMTVIDIQKLAKNNKYK